MFCSEFLSWRKEIQWWYCLLLEAYVTESKEFQSLIQAVDSTGHLCSSVSVSSEIAGQWDLGTRPGEIAFFPLLECNFSFKLLYLLSDFFGEGNGTPLQYSCLENPMDGGAWQAAVHGVAKSRTPLSDFTFTFHFHALEKEMATHSSVLAWRIPGTGEPGRLSSLGSHRVRHDWSDLAAAVTYLLDNVGIPASPLVLFHDEVRTRKGSKESQRGCISFSFKMLDLFFVSLCNFPRK